MYVSFVKFAKNQMVLFAIIAGFLCAFVAACGLRAAQSGGANDEVLNAPPLPPGAARDAVLRAGRETVRLISERNGAAVFAKLTPRMASSIPQVTMERSLRNRPVPTGSPLGEIVSGSQNAPIYYGLYAGQTKEQSVTVRISFNSEHADKIAGLLIAPQNRPAMQAEAVKQGRAAAALIARKDTGGVYALLAPNMVKAFSKTDIQNVLDSLITTAKPVGAKIGEIVVPAESDDGPLAYAAEFTYGPDNALKILMTFAPDTQKLTSLRLVPGLPAHLAPDPHANYQMKTHLRLPFAPGDKWTIAWGGDTRPQNYHVDYADQRHAFDILAVENGMSHTGDGKQLSQYFAWGRKIVAPADATVSEAVDGLPDNAPGTMNSAHAAGNHVLLNFGNNEYALLAHLQSGSVKVKGSQMVKAGDLLGLCGNSGNTTEPHLHFHVQDGPILFHAHGLPVTFWDYKSNGKPVKSGSPVQKEVVEAP